MVEDTIRLPDGRKLGILRFGADGGQPFLYFHGLPGSRFEALLIRRQALELNLRIIAVDRPGYGLSDHCETRSLLDWPGDVSAVADRLGLQRFGVIGVSGGGPYALACASAIADRLDAVGIVCGLGPVYDARLRHGMSLFSRTAFTLEDRLPSLFRLVYGIPLNSMSRIAPRQLVRMLALHCGVPDRDVILRKDVLANIATSLPEAFRQGSGAAARDLHLAQQPWGFELADIGIKVRLWHGGADPVVPPEHSRYIAARLPRNDLTVISDAGHFSLPILHAQSILETLKADAGAH